MTMITSIRMEEGQPQGLTTAGEWIALPEAVYLALTPFFLACRAKDGFSDN